MNEELNLCLASLLKMHFDNFQETEIYFTKNNFFGNIFRFQEMHYYFTSNFAFSFSFFLLKLIEPHMHSNSVQESERRNGDRGTKLHILGFPIQI